MTDKRSAIIKETSITISVMAQALGSQFEVLGVKLMAQNSLMKLISNANKVIAEHGHNCIVATLFCSRSIK